MSDSTLPTDGIDLTDPESGAYIAGADYDNCADCIDPFGLKSGQRLFDPANATDVTSLAKELAAVLNPLVKKVDDIERFCRWAQGQIETTTATLAEAQKMVTSGGIGGIMKLLKG